MAPVIESFRPPNVLSNSSVTRKALLFISALLLVLFVVASVALVQIAAQQNDQAIKQSLFYAEKAIQARQKSILAVVSDYAFWGEAYRHLHVQVDTDWAYTRQNLGPSLFPDFAFEGVFVVDANNHTAYAVVEGQLTNVERSSGSNKTSRRWSNRPVRKQMMRNRWLVSCKCPVGPRWSPPRLLLREVIRRSRPRKVLLRCCCSSTVSTRRSCKRLARISA